MILNDTVAIVTGGAGERGIGRATARLLAEHGASVAIADIDGEGAKRAADALQASFGRPTAGLHVDVTDRSACDSAVAAVSEALGPPTVLVNNAGISVALKTLDIGPQDYERLMDINLKGVLFMTQAVIPPMLRAGGGSIVNVASVAAQRGGGVFGGPHYAASKGGVLSLTKAVAREYAAQNIRCNAVNPGLIDTDIFQGGLTDERRAMILEQVPMARLGQPEDVAGCCLFLASPLSAYVTGAAVDVNGGLLIH